MMFFVTERRLQAILDRDRFQQEEIDRDLWNMRRKNSQALTDRVVAAQAELARIEAMIALKEATLHDGNPQLPDRPLTAGEMNALLAAKKAATKAARPARKPREKK